MSADQQAQETAIAAVALLGDVSVDPGETIDMRAGSGGAQDGATNGKGKSGRTESPKESSMPTKEGSKSGESSTPPPPTSEPASSDAGAGDENVPPHGESGSGSEPVTKDDNAVKLFIGQIPRSYNEDDLRPLFAPYGPIYELSIIKDKGSGSSRGCAFLTYVSRSSADGAVSGEHGRLTLEGMSTPIQVKYAEGELDRLGNQTKLFVGMLPKSATEEDLRSSFSSFGSIEDLTILRGPPPNGPSKGCGFVKYTSRSSALDAIASLHGSTSFPNATSPLVVKFADTPRQKHARLAAAASSQAILGIGGVPYPNYYGGSHSTVSMVSGSGPYLPPSGYSGLPPNLPLPPNGPLLPYSNVNNANYPTGSGPVPSYPNNSSPSLSYGYNNVPVLPPGLPPNMVGPPVPLPVSSPQAEGPPGANLFIYHLPQEYGDRELASLFLSFGNVVSAKVFIDRNTGTSKCFGFVSFSSPESASSAISAMNGYPLGNKRLKVQLKRDRPNPDGMNIGLGLSGLGGLQDNYSGGY